MTPEPVATTILVVEDDEDIAGSLGELLGMQGYRVRHARTGVEAKMMVAESAPDLIILDLMLPDEDGFTVCTNLKLIANVPIVICSATSRPGDVVLSLKLGADDFISKPFRFAELEARIEAVLRRSAQTASHHSSPPPLAAETTEVLRVGDLTLDLTLRRASLNDRPLRLTPTEFRILSALASRPGDVFSRSELRERVWNDPHAAAGRSLEAHVQKLQSKLRQRGELAPAVVAARDLGYKIAPSQTSEIGSAAKGLDVLAHGLLARALQRAASS